jgi:glycosyltransferase involved in cell wall biosynthesis
MPTKTAMTSPHKVPAGVDTHLWPRIALVTPVLNSGKYIEASIRSVLAQDYPNLDYFVVDGGSTDGTVDTIRKYEHKIAGWISEPDTGMYDALNKGFARARGEIMGWISGTDMLQPGGLAVAASVFRDLPDVEWITGRPTLYDEEGVTIQVGPIVRYSRIPFLASTNPSIQQESTYWRRSLWEKAGQYVDASRRMASDFELWVRFFRHARLFSVDALIGGFRKHGDSLGLQEMKACYAIQSEIIERELGSVPRAKVLRALREVNALVKRIPAVRFAWWRLIEKPVLDRQWGAPPVIEFQKDKWGFRE